MKQKNYHFSFACAPNEVQSSPPVGCRLPFGKAAPYAVLRIITEGAKCTPTGACCVLIAATAKEPRRQIPPLLADGRCFWEIAAGVVAKPEARFVAVHRSSRLEYLIRAMPQRWTPGTEMTILVLVNPESVEGWIGFPEGTPPCPGLSYQLRSPCSPTAPPHHQTLLLLLDLFTQINVKPASIGQWALRTCELPT